MPKIQELNTTLSVTEENLNPNQPNLNSDSSSQDLPEGKPSKEAPRKKAAVKKAQPVTPTKKAAPKKSVPSKTTVSSKKKTFKEVEGEIVYPKYDFKLCCTPCQEAVDFETAPLGIEEAKELLGWEENPGGNLDFKDRFLFIDLNGKKIRCKFNPHNRPYKKDVMKAWMVEILRGKWQLNGETIIIGKYGNILSGQHRLIALVLAHQEWEKDQTRPKPDQLWAEVWGKDNPPTMSTFLVTGISEKDEVVNTQDTGKPRTFEDVLYRCNWFSDKPEKERAQLAKVCDHAVRLVRERTAQNLEWNRRTGMASTFKTPHSDCIEFVENHSRILECVRFINEEREGKLKPLIGGGMAAGLLYLMGSAASDSDKYDQVNNEKALDWSLFDKACEFWVDFLGEEKSTEAIREALLDDRVLPPGSGGRYAQEVKAALCVKGWNLYSDKKKITREGIELNIELNSEGIPTLAEVVITGGIDIGISPKANKDTDSDD